MTYKLHPQDRDLSATLVRIAQQEAARARVELEDPALATEDKIHQARKRTKRLRGMLRLFRSAFADFDDENAFLRSAARQLSRLRDRDVMIATHDRLMQESGADRRAYAPVRAHLTRARNRVAAAHDPDAALAVYAAEMDALSKRAAHWTLTGKDAVALRDGLEVALAASRRAMRRARTGRDIEDLHEWRKRVKHHWYHIRLLQPIDPAALKERARVVGDLGEVLGDINDLDVYRNHLAGPEATGLNAEKRDALIAMATLRIARLQQEALATGKPLFTGAPDVPAVEWSNLWKAWRKTARKSAKAA